MKKNRVEELIEVLERVLGDLTFEDIEKTRDELSREIENKSKIKT